MPKSAVASVSTRSPTENAPSTTRTGRESTMRLSAAGAAARRRAPPAAAAARGEQQDERDGEDDRRADEEVDRRDREVTDDPDPVREKDRHGSTVISAICTPRCLELDLEAARDRRLERQPNGSARLDVARDVVAVEMDLVGDVGLHDEHDAVVLVHGLADDAALRRAVHDHDPDDRRRLGRRSSSSPSSSSRLSSSCRSTTASSLSSEPQPAIDRCEEQARREHTSSRFSSRSECMPPEAAARSTRLDRRRARRTAPGGIAIDADEHRTRPRRRTRLEPRPQRSRRPRTLDGGEQPTREQPRDERDGELQRQPDEEHRRRDEDRHTAAVHDPLDVLLERRTSQAPTSGNDPRRRRVRLGAGCPQWPVPRERAGGAPAVRARGTRGKGPSASTSAGRRAQCADEHARGDDRRDDEPRAGAVHGPDDTSAGDPSRSERAPGRPAPSEPRTPRSGRALARYQRTAAARSPAQPSA